MRSVASTPVRADGPQLGVLTVAPRAARRLDARRSRAARGGRVEVCARASPRASGRREPRATRRALGAPACRGGRQRRARARAVLQRLVDEVAALLQADASDCYLYDRERGMLRCAAVHGLDASLVGFEFAADRGLSGLAIREGRALDRDGIRQTSTTRCRIRRTPASPTRSSRRCGGATRCAAFSASVGAGTRPYTRATVTCSRRSPVSPRWRFATPRRSAGARGRRASSAASTGSRPCSASRCRAAATLDAVAQAAAEALGGAPPPRSCPRRTARLQRLARAAA